MSHPDCIRDDSTECDCPACIGDDFRWEHWQGWHAGDDFVPDCPQCQADLDEDFSDAFWCDP